MHVILTADKITDKTDNPKFIMSQACQSTNSPQSSRNKGLKLNSWKST